MGFIVSSPPPHSGILAPLLLREGAEMIQSPVPPYEIWLSFAAMNTAVLMIKILR